MKILAKDIISSDKSTFEGKVSARLLDVDREYWWLGEDPTVIVEGYRVGEYIYLSIRAEADTFMVCTRCLEEQCVRKNWEFTHQIRVVDELQEIDISELLREEIILNIGVKVLCREDCKGICPVCGGNRNLGECRCFGGDLDGTSKEEALQVSEG